MLRIRSATNNDAEAIAELSGQLGYGSSPEQVHDRLSTILSDPQAAVLVACEGATLVGWMHVFVAHRVETDAFAEIGGLVVRDTMRRRGVGGQLVQEAVAWARERSCSRLRVRSNTLRTESHAFYHQFGFRSTKDQRIHDLTLSDRST